MSFRTLHVGHRPTASAPCSCRKPDNAPGGVRGLLQSREHFDRLALYTVESLPLGGSKAARTLARWGLGDDANRDWWGGVPCGRQLHFDIARIAREFGRQDVHLTGLANTSGNVTVSCDHAIVPWRDETGHVQTLQRLMLTDAARAAPASTFAPGRAPAQPYGAEHIHSSSFAEVAFVQGALNTLAYRKAAALQGRNVLVLGLPETQVWDDSWTRYVQGRVVSLALNEGGVEELACTVISERLAAHGCTWWRHRPADGHDWTSYAAGCR